MRRIITEAQKVSSALEKDLTRVKAVATREWETNCVRKVQIKEMSDFIRKLLNEKRVTKDEIRGLFTRKKVALAKFRKENNRL